MLVVFLLIFGFVVCGFGSILDVECWQCKKMEEETTIIGCSQTCAEWFAGDPRCELLCMKLLKETCSDMKYCPSNRREGLEAEKKILGHEYAFKFEGKEL